MGEAEIEKFLSDLAINKNCASTTQNQALNALVILFREVLGFELGKFKNIVWAKRKTRIPEVMTREEVVLVLRAIKVDPQKWLVASLLYGCGLRLSEVMRLRVKDLDFRQGFITIRNAKGDKDRAVPLPKRLVIPLKKQLLISYSIHNVDLKNGFGRVSLPFALQRKYPNADGEWIWQYVFPSFKLSKDPYSGDVKRHHIFDSFMEEIVKKAASSVGLTKRITCHTFRHSFATPC